MDKGTDGLELLLLRYVYRVYLSPEVLSFFLSLALSLSLSLT